MKKEIFDQLVAGTKEAIELERQAMGDEARDRKVDLTMFAGYHMGWLTLKGGKVPAVTYEEIHAMIDEYCSMVLPIYRDDDDEPEGKVST